MMQEPFRADSYLKSCEAIVESVEDNRFELDQLVFCPMNRLYLKQGWRGQGLDRKLTLDCLSFATHAGCAKMRLDTERRLEAAIDIYRKFGFQEINHYFDRSPDDMLYMEKDLT